MAGASEGSVETKHQRGGGGGGGNDCFQTIVCASCPSNALFGQNFRRLWINDVFLPEKLSLSLPTSCMCK